MERLLSLSYSTLSTAEYATGGSVEGLAGSILPAKRDRSPCGVGIAEGFEHTPKSVGCLKDYAGGHLKIDIRWLGPAVMLLVGDDMMPRGQNFSRIRIGIYQTKSSISEDMQAT